MTYAIASEVQAAAVLSLPAMIGLVFSYKASRNAKQANDAVNHKADGEPTLREMTIEMRETMQYTQADVGLIRTEVAHLAATLLDHIQGHSH